MTHFRCSRCHKDRGFQDISPVTRPQLTNITLSEADRQGLLICRYCLPTGGLEDVIGKRARKVEIRDVPPGPVSEDRVLTAQQIQDEWGIPRGTIHSWVYKGHLPKLPESTRQQTLVRESDLLPLVEGFTTGARKARKPRTASQALQRYLHQTNKPYRQIARETGLTGNTIGRAARGEHLNKSTIKTLNKWWKKQPAKPEVRAKPAPVSGPAPWDSSLKVEKLEAQVARMEAELTTIDTWVGLWRAQSPDWVGWEQLAHLRADTR